MPQGILTGKMIKKAINLAKPSIFAILNDPKSVWRPKYVAINIAAPGLMTRYKTDIDAETKSWDPEWPKKKQFALIAEKKTDLSEREQASTREIIAMTPWLVQKGEYLYPGGVYCEDIIVSVSGAKGDTDEAIANIILAMIVFLSYQETTLRKEENRMIV